MTSAKNAAFEMSCLFARSLSDIWALCLESEVHMKIILKFTRRQIQHLSLTPQQADALARLKFSR